MKKKGEVWEIEKLLKCMSGKNAKLQKSSRKLRNKCKTNETNQKNYK